MNILFFISLFIAFFFISTLFGYLIPMMSKELKFKKSWGKCPNCEKEKTIEKYNVVNFWKYGGYCKKCKPAPIKNVFFSIFFALFSVSPFVISYIDSKQIFTVESICFSVITMVLFYAFFTDIKGLVIPDFTNLTVIAIGIGLLTYNIIETNNYSLLLSHGIGMICISLPLFLLCLLGKSGFGDVKLFFALGLFLGWQKLLLVLFIAVITGTIFIIFKKINNPKLNRKSQIPFGPFICIGTYTSMFFGDFILSSYFNLF